MLPPINVLNTSDMSCQLVLVRYDASTQNVGFPVLPQFGAMWTNGVTCHHKMTANLTGINRGSICKTLRVVRLGFPSDTDIFNISNCLDIGLISPGWEFELKFCISAIECAMISLDSMAGMFVKPAGYSPKQIGPMLPWV